MPLSIIYRKHNSDEDLHSCSDTMHTSCFIMNCRHILEHKNTQSQVYLLLKRICNFANLVLTVTKHGNPVVLHLKLCCIMISQTFYFCLFIANATVTQL